MSKDFRAFDSCLMCDLYARVINFRIIIINIIIYVFVLLSLVTEDRCDIVPLCASVYRLPGDGCAAWQSRPGNTDDAALCQHMDLWIINIRRRCGG